MKQSEELCSSVSTSNFQREEVLPGEAEIFHTSSDGGEKFWAKPCTSSAEGVEGSRGVGGAPAEFLLYSVVVALCVYGSFQIFSSRYPDEEYRDRLFFLCLPLWSEISYWISRTVAGGLCGARKWRAAGFFQRWGLDAFLIAIPILLGCVAFVEASPSPGIGACIFLGMLSYQVVRSRLKVLRYSEIIEVPAALVLVWYAFSLLVLVADKDPHHWAFYLGPAYAVMGGGHLLWDVPSQYGFLNILSIAEIAREFRLSVTDSMALLLVSLELLSVGVTFCLFRFRLGLSTFTAALCVVAVHLCLPSWIEHYAGPAYTPSTSALRFSPALLALLAFDRAAATPNAFRVVVAGLCSAIAVMWSPESCLYTLAPLGVYGLLRFIHKPCLSFFAGPVVRVCALASFLVGVFLWSYYQTLPHGMDITSFYEFAATYATSFGLIPIELDLWTALFATVIVVSFFVAHERWREGDHHSAQGALFFTYIFCIATYFVARSSYRNVHNLIPWFLTALAAISVNRSGAAAKARFFLTTSIAALCLGWFISLYEGDNRTRIFERQATRTFHVLPKYEQIPVEVVEAAREVVKGSEFTFVQDLALIYEPAAVAAVGGNILPITPIRMFSILSVERQRLYLDRMLERAPKSYVLCIERVCPVVPYTLQNMKDFVDVVELPFSAVGGWKLLEISKK